MLVGGGQRGGPELPELGVQPPGVVLAAEQVGVPALELVGGEPQCVVGGAETLGQPVPDVLPERGRGRALPVRPLGHGQAFDQGVGVAQPGARPGQPPSQVRDVGRIAGGRIEADGGAAVAGVAEAAAGGSVAGLSAVGHRSAPGAGTGTGTASSSAIRPRSVSR